MARPSKQGLDYFPMDVEIDDKIELIEAKHGIAGFGILVKLFQRIYKEGYYLELSEECLLLFSRRINVSHTTVTAVINDCLCYHLFDKGLNEQFNILTSAGIQKRYLNAIERRKEVTLDKRYIIVDTNLINVNINWINDYINPQSKVKESKVNNTWRDSFDLYLTECKHGYAEYMKNEELLKTQSRLHPGVNVRLSIEKGYVNFWSTEAGWHFKKKSRTKEINWQNTITNSIDMNKVYYTKQELEKQTA